MKKLLIAGVAVVALIATAAALADYAIVSRGDKWALKANLSPSAGGTTAKPVPVAVGFTATETADTGLRPSTPTAESWKWSNVVYNGGDFPKCSPTAVAAQKSISVCPKKSLIAKLTIKALLGPASPSTPGYDTLAESASCVKYGAFYNSGQGTGFLWAYGPGSICAGVAYLPPILMTYTKTSTGTEVKLPLPSNIQHPLPGVEGGFTFFGNVQYKKLTTKVKGKTVGLFESICKKGTKRTFSFLSGDPAPQDPFTTTLSLGKCG